MNKVYAVTGGIGSGKSTVCKIIKEEGYPCYSADEIYKELLLNKDFVNKIYSALNILDDSGVFNKQLVSQKVFNNKELLEKLNSVTHPEIIKELKRKSSLVNGICFNEVPLLFEGNYQDLYDGVIVVVRNTEKRIESLLKRDVISKEEILKRINSQFDYQKIQNSTHTVITNDEDIKTLTQKVKAVISGIKKQN